MTMQPTNPDLPPPQPPDRPGIRPAANWQKVADMVRLIQKKLAGERAAKQTQKTGGNLA